MLVANQRAHNLRLVSKSPSPCPPFWTWHRQSHWISRTGNVTHILVLWPMLTHTAFVNWPQTHPHEIFACRSVAGFLDPKDTSLAFAVYGASQMNIFPIEVLDVTSQGCSKKEYLLCFNGKSPLTEDNARKLSQLLSWARFLKARSG